VPPTGVPVATARTVSRWIATHRKTHDVRPWQRAATSWVQAVMLLRWLIDATDVTAVARDAGVSPATAYRYLHEALDVVSSKAPDLPDVLRTLKDEGEPFVRLDGTVILTDRVAERDPDTGYHLWYSGKHKALTREHPSGDRPHRLPRVDLAGGARLGPRHHRRP